jgi:hypothetical protein
MILLGFVYMPLVCFGLKYQPKEPRVHHQKIYWLHTMADQTYKQVKLPQFDDLPLDASHPPHSAWFLFGQEDQLGCLNHLTPERVAHTAANEIRTGVSVGLNWGLDQMKVPPFYRTKLKHEIFSIGEFINVGWLVDGWSVG